MKMKKMILVSAITTIVIMGLMMLIMHLCPICDNCASNHCCPQDSTEVNCTHHGEIEGDIHDSEHKCPPGCVHGEVEEHSGHGHDNFHSMDALKTERAEFDNLLSEDEKAEITKAREAIAGIDHKEMGYEAMAEQYQEEFNAIQAIADKYNAEIDAIFQKKHGDMMPEDMNHSDISEEDMAEMMIKFKMHFLTMEF